MRARTLASLLVALLIVGVVATGAGAQAPVSQFDAILADEVVTTVSMTTPDMSVSDDLTVGDDLTVSGSLISTSSDLGASSVTTLSSSGAIAPARLTLAQGSQQTVVASSSISVTTAVANITAATPVTVGSIYTGTDGQVLIIVNAGTNAIIVPDSGLNRLSGALTLGQYDTVTLMWFAAAWTQLATSNN